MKANLGQEAYFDVSFSPLCGQLDVDLTLITVSDSEKGPYSTIQLASLIRPVIGWKEISYDHRIKKDLLAYGGSRQTLYHFSPRPAMSKAQWLPWKTCCHIKLSGAFPAFLLEWLNTLDSSQSINSDFMHDNAHLVIVILFPASNFVIISHSHGEYFSTS